MNKLLVACYCVNFENYDFLLEILAPLQQYGIGVELSLFADAGYLSRLRAQVDRFSPYYTTFHGPHLEVEATSPLGSASRQFMIDAFRESFDVYHAFGAHSIVVHTNQRTFTAPEREELQRNAVSTLQEIALLARDREALLLIENVGEENIHNMLFDPAAFADLFEQVDPSAGCLIDLGHAMINRWDMRQVIRTLSGRIKGYHLHNNDGVRDIHTPLFQPGAFYTPAQLQAFFGWAEEYTPDADWILEYAPGPHITRELVQGEVEQALRMLGK